MIFDITRTSATVQLMFRVRPDFMVSIFQKPHVSEYRSILSNKFKKKFK